VETFKLNTRITDLSLRLCYFPGEALQMLVASLHLVSLDLEGNAELSAANLEVMATYLSSLKKLNLSNCYELDDAAVQAFVMSSTTNLQELYLGSCSGISDMSIFTIGQCSPQLLKLSVSETQCTDASLHILETQCTKLIWLDLDGCAVSFVGVSKLTGTMTQLQHLSLANCAQLTSRSISVLKSINPQLFKTQSYNYSRELRRTTMSYTTPKISLAEFLSEEAPRDVSSSEEDEPDSEYVSIPEEAVKI